LVDSRLGSVSYQSDLVDGGFDAAAIISPPNGVFAQPGRAGAVLRQQFD